MSTAALQTPPHHQQAPANNITSLGSQQSPSISSASGRPYSSSQSKEPYPNQQPTSSSSSNDSPTIAATSSSTTTARRSSRRPTGNGASSNNSQQPQYYAPTGSLINTAVPTASRMANPTSSTSNSASATTSSQADRARGGPPVAPPRTSSNQRSTVTADPGIAAASAVSRTASAKGEERQPISPRMAATGDGHEQEIIGNGRSSGPVNDRREGASAASRSRRRTDQEQLPHRPNGGQNTQASSARSIGPTNAITSPPGPMREPSEIINRMVVSSPEVDYERERARLAEAIGINAPAVVQTETREAEVPRRRQDHSSSKREKTSKFGDYFLGNTLGEGEFGKVKMGWKQTGGPDVAIKLIRKESVGSNPTRLAKIYREIAILREISHPNIVRLHEKVETERHIGIILEYASGGELFDYILLHRYLKDQHARRLFAQLISGVGYLHKKGIVHRDLKLENLLLDRNRNIIITDFGFANTFNASDELGDDIEYNLGSRDYVKRMELDKILSDGHRRGDLMQTSCGSPCYAAPELVVSDSLYTGRKVDVWSCGVILYAMLAGYLPFDDDPANPEGDNINLLYKYIVSTPLTFPEYVTPHARDLLRRILVPDPRKRADLFEVARHSWLSEYAHVVGFITSSTTTTGDIANTTVGVEEEPAVSSLNRSASVREASKSQKPQPAVGELGRKHGNVDQDDAELHLKPQKDNKRRTVQVEYVPPRSETLRGAPPVSSSTAKPRSRGGSGGQGAQETTIHRKPVNSEKPLPKDPSLSEPSRRPSSRQKPQSMAPPPRSGRDVQSSASDTAYTSTGPRPPTGNSMGSTTSRSGSMGLVTRGSYGQPVAPTVAGTNAQGRMSQPGQGRSYSQNTSTEHRPEYAGRPSVPSKFAKVSGFTETGRPESSTTKSSHKRSNTVGSFIQDRFFGRSSSKKDHHDRSQEKKYPPVSMANKMPVDGESSRKSMDSRRSISFGFSRKRSGSITTSDSKPRRMSNILASWSLKAIGIGKDTSSSPDTPSYTRSFEDHQTVGGQSQNNDRYDIGDAGSDTNRESPVQENRRGPQSPLHQTRFASEPMNRAVRMSAGSSAAPQFRQGESALTTESDSSIDHYNQAQNQSQYRKQQQTYTNRGVLQKPHRKFVDAYDSTTDGKAGRTAGSSGAARKVMDFFRRRVDRNSDG